MNVIEFNKGNYKNYRLIEGFPSPDLSATITTKYMVDSLKMEKIGFIENEDMFPVVRITNGLPEHPIRIYASDKHKLLVILSDQIIPQNLIIKYSKTLVDWAKMKKIKDVFTIASVKSKEKNSNVFLVANTDKNKEKLNGLGLKFVKDGLTSGLSAQMLVQDNIIPIYLVLGILSENTSYDVAGKIIDAFNKILGLNIETKTLYNQSDKILKQIKNQIKETEEQKTDTKQKEMMYI
jgi:predicted ATP-grasp superfamily ATP-dependent carboligase